MKVLLVKPGEYAEEVEIDNRLSTLQKIVGGRIEIYSPNNDPVTYVLNEEGKLAELPRNRAIYNQNGNIVDIIHGNFLVCGVGEEDFVSLSPELMAKYKAIFLEPEIFVYVEGRLNAVKSKPSISEQIKSLSVIDELKNDVSVLKLAVRTLTDELAQLKAAM